MCKRHLNKNVSRRDILKYSLAGAGIAALGPLGSRIRVASGAPLSQPRVLSIFGYGGYDGLNLCVPTGNAAYYDRRMVDVNNYDPNTDIAIQPADALDLGSGYGLHPSFQRVKGLWDDGDVAIFRKVGYPNRNLSHFISQDIHSYGVRGDFNDLPGVDVSGWIARYADSYAQTSMGAAALGVGRALEFTGGSTNPLISSRLSNFDYSDSSIGNTDHTHRLEAAKNVLAAYSGDTLSTEAKNALDQGYTLADQIQMALSAFDADAAVGNGYANNSPGRYMRDAAALIHGGFETEVFMTGIGGWDTHGNQGGPTGRQSDLIGRLDSAIGTFKDDCETMGVWDNMLILISSEFGRRNFMNGSTGTDHGHGNMFFAIGGAVGAAGGGGLYGDDVTESDIADNNWINYTLDYRDIFKQAVTHLGGTANVVFPEAQVIDTPLAYV